MSEEHNEFLAHIAQKMFRTNKKKLDKYDIYNIKERISRCYGYRKCLMKEYKHSELYNENMVNKLSILRVRK
jgi:hypothetical protein